MALWTETAAVIDVASVAGKERVMDVQQVENATRAWVEAWLYGNAQPRVVVEALGRLARQHADQPRTLAIVEQGRRVIECYPFGSIQEQIAA